MGLSIKNEVKYYILKRDREMSEIADKLGISLQNFSNKLRRETIQYRDVKRIAEMLGYEIVWKKKI